VPEKGQPPIKTAWLRTQGLLDVGMPQRALDQSTPASKARFARFAKALVHRLRDTDAM
jgi:hypothetical protein